MSFGAGVIPERLNAGLWKLLNRWLQPRSHITVYGQIVAIFLGNIIKTLTVFLCLHLLTYFFFPLLCIPLCFCTNLSITTKQVSYVFLLACLSVLIPLSPPLWLSANLCSVLHQSCSAGVIMQAWCCQPSIQELSDTPRSACFYAQVAWTQPGAAASEDGALLCPCSTLPWT